MLSIVRLLATGILCFTFLTGCSAVRTTIPAAEDRFTFTYGPYVYHFSSHPDHIKYPKFTSVEWESEQKGEWGAAYFRNSYNQPSGYFYGGKRWSSGTTDHQLYCKLTAGALLGYVGKYERRIPVNWKGFGLAIIPAVGYKYRRVSTQVVFLGISALMLTVGYDFWP